MRTLRLSLTYDQDEVRLDTADILDVPPPRGDPRPRAGTDAYWLEARAGRRVFRRRLPDPAIGTEVFSPEGAVARAERPPRRVIVVDLPWWGPKTSLAFHSGVAGGGPVMEAMVAAAGWRAVARFDGAALEDAAAVHAITLEAAAAPGPVTTLDFGQGQPATALTLVFLAEGFRTAELGAYRAIVTAFLDRMETTAPFDAMLPALAALRVDCVSNESGIDDPANHTNVDTLFNGHFGAGSLRRLIEVDQGKALAAAKAAAHDRKGFVGLVVVNTTEYGGSGGKVAVFSRDTRSADIALHELGHTLFGLADEYSASGGSTGTPSEPNVTAKPASGSAWGPHDRARLKWRDLVPGPSLLPSNVNTDCSQPLNAPGQAGVGAFEGGKYKHCGIWRPTADCKMRTLTADFCPVCQREIANKLRAFLP
jgi:hypothetical protein